MSALGALILIVLILATLHEGSPEVTFYEFLMAGTLAVVFFFGTTKFLISRERISRPLFYLLAFFAWAGVNSVIALSNGVEPLWWFRRFFPILVFSLMPLASIGAFRTPRQIRAAFLMLSLISVAIVLQGLYLIRSVDIATVTNLQALRKYGGGYYSAFGLCLIVPLLFSPLLKRLQRFVIALGSVILFTGLILSFTRTYWLSTAVALLFMVYLLVQARGVAFPALLVRVAMPAVLVLAFLFWTAPPIIREFTAARAVTIPQAIHDLSFLDRIEELRGLWDSAVKNPLGILGGNGLGAKFTFYSPNPWSWGGTGWIENDYSHNYYAYLFWSTGLMGLSLFLLFWGSMLRQASKALQYSSNVSAGFLYYLIGICTAVVNLLVASLTGPPLMGLKWAVYFGILIGLALNIAKMYRNQARPGKVRHVHKI